MPLIKKMKLKNFRAFTAQEFNFKKLNIFVGKNNSGKSSAISALNVIAQTLKMKDLDDTPLRLNGQFTNLGTYIDVVNGNHSARKIGIDLYFGKYQINSEFKYRTIRKNIELIKSEIYENDENIFKYQMKSESYDIQLARSSGSIFNDAQKRKPTFNGFVPVRINISSVAILKDIETYKRFNNSNRQIYRPGGILLGYFDSFDSLSPFRDNPERTYLYSGEDFKNIGLSGSNMAAFIASDHDRRGVRKSSIINKVSKWFDYAGIAKSVSIKRLTPRHFELCLTSNDGSTHNICDVGFGCSQVLPVLVSGYNIFSEENKSGIFIVQEPEIHLHPNAQAAMGSFFVELAQGNGQIFVETHSDNLILRVARHVALGHLSPDDVQIIHVSDVENHKVTEIGIDKFGSFTKKFPEDFFPQRKKESFNLARAGMLAEEEEIFVKKSFEYPESN